MRTVTLPGVERPPSVLVQGAMGLLNLDDDEAFACLDESLQAGVTAFDTAHVYAAGERTVDHLIGRWIRNRDVRREVVIMAKGCHPEPPDWEQARVDPAAVAADVHDTLDRMALDHLDVWSFHRDDPSVDIASLVDAVNREISAGRITAWGVSNWSAPRIQQALDHANTTGQHGPVMHSAHYSLVDQVSPPWDDVVTLTGEIGAENRKWHLERRFPVVAWSALAGGVLSANLSREVLAAAPPGHLADVFRSYNSERNWARRSRAEDIAGRLGVELSAVAIAWLLQSELAPLAIVGGANPHEIRQNAAATTLELSPEDHQYLFEPEDPA